MYLTFPFVTFADNDLWCLLAESGARNASECIFQKMPDKAVARVAPAYIAAMSGEHGCAHTVEIVGECILFGIKVYPEAFRLMRATLLMQCWRMLDAEANAGRTELITTVASVICLVPKSPQTSVLLGKVQDNALMSRTLHVRPGPHKTISELALQRCSSPRVFEKSHSSSKSCFHTQELLFQERDSEVHRSAKSRRSVTSDLGWARRDRSQLKTN